MAYWEITSEEYYGNDLFLIRGIESIAKEQDKSIGQILEEMFEEYEKMGMSA